MCNGSTGTGLTVTFMSREETPAAIVVGRIRAADLQEYAQEAVDFTDLDRATTCKKPGNVTDLGELTLDVFFDASIAKPVPGTLATMTVTFPITADGTTKATLVATGFFRSLKWPNAAINEPMMSPFIFTLDGHDPTTGQPTFTIES